jgi:hypothetical protein
MKERQKAGFGIKTSKLTNPKTALKRSAKV